MKRYVQSGIPSRPDRKPRSTTTTLAAVAASTPGKQRSGQRETSQAKVVLLHSCHNLASVVSLIWNNDRATLQALEKETSLRSVSPRPLTTAGASADAGSTGAQLAEPQLRLSRQSIVGNELVKAIMRIITKIKTSPETVTLALYYVYHYRLHLLQDPLQHEDVCEAHIFGAALMVANKFHDDIYYKTRDWALMMNISHDVLFQIERRLLAGISYSLNIPRPEFVQWSKHMDTMLRTYHRMFGSSLSRPCARKAQLSR